MARDQAISERMNRIEEIVERLDADECSLDEGEDLHEEGKRLLTEVRERLHDGDGEIIEIE